MAEIDEQNAEQSLAATIQALDDFDTAWLRASPLEQHSLWPATLADRIVCPPGLSYSPEKKQEKRSNRNLSGTIRFAQWVDSMA